MKIREYKNKDVSCYSISGSSDFLTGLKKINIFVGANNCGKSRFLRQMFSSNNDDFVFFDDVNDELQQIFNDLVPRFKNLYYMKNLESLISSRTGDYVSRFNDFFEKIESHKQRNSGVSDVWDIDVANGIKAAMVSRGIYRKLEKITGVPKLKHVYIPILRGLRQVYMNGNSPQDVYKEITASQYSLFIQEMNKAGDRYDIFSGLSVYREIKEMLLGSKQERLLVREYEKFLSKEFFQNREVTIVPMANSPILKINIEHEHDREIHNVGDGIQSIIINTFPVFKFQEENLLLFIEEPELTMHPSIQRVLIETLISKFVHLQVFLTTHSNHFLDLTYDYPKEVAIFSFGEKGKESFEIKNVTRNVEILDILGIRNSSVFLANCVIWTEGVTDRMILKTILVLDNDFLYKEDYHYAFAEYGGGNLASFDFIGEQSLDAVEVSSISKNNYIIADNDGNKEGRKAARRKRIKNLIGVNRFFDEHIEIENLVPYAIWVIVIRNLLSDKPEKNIKMKVANPKDEGLFNNSLETDKIGDLLKKYIVEEKDIADVPFYFSKSDIQCLGETKKVIARYVVDVIVGSQLTLNDFPQTTKKLVKSIKSFIASANKME